MRKRGKQDQRSIFLQGVIYKGQNGVNRFLKAIEREFSEAGYCIVRESLVIGNSSGGRATPHIKAILRTFKTLSELANPAGLEISQDISNGHREANRIVVRTPAFEYAARLAEEGYTPDLSLFKYVLKHVHDHDQQHDHYYRRMLEKYGSWEKMVEQALGSIKVTRFAKALSWREERTASQVETLMSSDIKKVAVFISNHHVKGLAAILQQKGWHITYSNNLELREEKRAAPFNFYLLE